MLSAESTDAKLSDVQSRNKTIGNFIVSRGYLVGLKFTGSRHARTCTTHKIPITRTAWHCISTRLCGHLSVQLSCSCIFLAMSAYSRWMQQLVCEPKRCPVISLKTSWDTSGLEGRRGKRMKLITVRCHKHSWWRKLVRCCLCPS